MSKNLKGYELLTESLCAENCLGRWYWKSGELKNDNSIPWEEQNINTCPENFLWEENKTSILTVSPGVYELKWALFSTKHKPVFDVMINGIKWMTQASKSLEESEEKNRRMSNELKGKVNN